MLSYSRFCFALTLLILLFSPARAEDGYRLWLRYEPIPTTSDIGRQYRVQLATWSVLFESFMAKIVLKEIIKGVKGFLNKKL